MSGEGVGQFGVCRKGKRLQMRRVDCQGEYDGNLGITSESVLIKGVSVELMHDCRRELVKPEEGAARVVYKFGPGSKKNCGALRTALGVMRKCPPTRQNK